MANRKMPQNLEAEMSVLGVTFFNKSSSQNIPLDITTLTEELDKKKNLNAVGGIEYITEVIDSVATAANVDYYINIVREKATLRSLIDTATEIITDAYDNEDNINVILDSAERNILSVLKKRQTSDFITIGDALKMAQENLERLAKNKSDITGVPTGFYDLDKATSGLHAGEMIIIAARPGMGKTAFALNIATNAAFNTDKSIAIFNLEMPAEQLVNRMISAVGQIDSKKLQTGQLQHTDWKKYNEAMSQLADTNIYIEDDAGITASEIKAKCRRLAASENGLGLVVIDYLQLVTSGAKRNESRQQEVSEISRSLKTMAMELKVPVIALAQLSRNAEKRENNQPMLADLRESGSIEQDADLVMFIKRKDY